MKTSVLLLALMMIAVPASAAEIPVQTGHTEWQKFPQAPKKARPLEVRRLIDWTESVLRSGECKVAGMKPEKFDIDVPYAVLLTPDGTVQRIIIPEMGCPGLNTLIGSTVHDWAQRGHFEPTGQPEPLWFVDRIAFARE